MGKLTSLFSSSSPIIAGVAAALATGYYVNDKYQLTKDLTFVRGAFRARKKYEACIKDQDCSLYNRFEEQCQIRPFAIALAFEGASYTWRDLELASNRMAHWFVSKGVQSSDRVAMMMHNSPLFLIVWLALLKMAAIPAFINNQITGPVLLHSLKVTSANLLVFDYELAPVVEECLEDIKGLGYNVYTVTPKQHILGQFYGHLSEAARQKIEIPTFFDYAEWGHLSTEGFPKSVRKHVEMKDPAALIFTSGTTGFPKAAVMDHGRCTVASVSWSMFGEITADSKVYVTLPLYHSAGSIVGVGQSWTSGSTIVLARKFSVTNFWKDCIAYDVTHFQYIGELCRYLLNAPESPLDKKHKVRLAFGNGMRPDIWAKFQERFSIPTVFEYYTMSEGTGALFNIAKNKRDQGAVGFRGPIVRTLAPGFKLVKVDTDTEELIRDKKTGFCIECGPDEIGELLTLADNKTPGTRFVGYFNQPKMSQAKLVHDALAKGDIYMRTGDLLYRTKDQYWYFADRAGDTYRWKGENVSTAEIADSMGRVDGLTSCTVYGVSVPGQDGRAGMAALVLKDSIIQPASDGRTTALVNEDALADFVQRMGDHVAKSLPPYAVPRFLRICEHELETTGTFKNKKVELRKEGFDLHQVKDRMYWWTPQGCYKPFGHPENGMIVAGRARL
ncbi:putative bifunctional fatty acid transporter/acyl-CoA synthetase FAT1 [Gamsiella multidivaricata]|uniref:putative bifunctional fatty acid transporter/acyl-CoA synthetase FAT1 n=1 Tax=Gamsiella multidivaricata TaxID=101098 RepID=UPI00221FEF12|nr:putative bifunctional fatty acid transporter/acyl-CoA synthetase FAT1 [Gamsiella multidivaricata]KAI7832844.1 putative bifunctional fatty acid transporter/acyl-CoA synthetase FAT1 [Gamsiella multidivaricata]